ncbi:MAG TPA: general secretion pathway protein GspM [Xanthomonadaceae bacterium]|jgi:general secretion pathway protein M|nr:general secretion pathway protein GspM [Xanthomonadaceae bacterium]
MRRRLERLRPLLWLGIAAVLGYGLLVHWWWTAPMLALGDEIAALRDDELLLRMEGEQMPQLEARLAEVRAAEAANPGFLAEPDKDLATAALVQRLEADVRRVAAHALACEVVSRTPIDAPSSDPYPRVTVNIRLRCDSGTLGRLLHALESGSPQLFIDNMALNSTATFFGGGGEADSRVDVVFDLYGYLRPPPRTGIDAAGAPDA